MIYCPQNWEAINGLHMTPERDEHSNKCPFPRDSYTSDLDVNTCPGLCNIFQVSLKISNWLLQYLGLQRFSNFHHHTPLVRALPHIQSLWCFHNHIQSLFEAHPEIFRPIQAFFVLITWPRSSPHPALQNYPIVLDFVSMYSNSLQEYMVTIPDYSVQ
jgi:hypothetical protein